VFLQLLDEPARIVDADVKLIVGTAEERPRELAQLARLKRRPRASVARNAADRSGNLRD
jgi:hypothetical protein